jgi:hypothetical protein
MAINLTNLFTALGHLYYPLKRGHAYVATQLAADVPAAVTGLGVANADIGGPLAAGLDGWEAAVTSQLAAGLRTAAGAYLLRVVNADVGLPDARSVPLALAELVRQMIAQSYKVATCTVTVAAAAVSGNTGNGAVVITSKRGDGLTQQNLFAEVGLLSCTGDNQAGTATAGSEPFQYRGDPAPSGVDRETWPGASGATAGTTAVDAAGTSPNLLTNSDFEDFTTANTPDSWTLGSGTVAGTNIFSEASLVYAGSKAVKFLGNGSTRPIIRQTLTTLKPNRVYAINGWVRSSGTLTTTGNLKFRLVDGSNAVIVDDQSAENGVTAALTGLTTTYTAKGGVLITPKVLPATVKLQIEASNGADLVTSEAVYLDNLAMAEVSFLYGGGPALAVFSGSVPFMSNDAFDITTTNNRAGQSYGATFQTVFDRWFNMKQLGLLLPVAGSTLLDDTTLIA